MVDDGLEGDASGRAARNGGRQDSEGAEHLSRALLSKISTVLPSLSQEEREGLARLEQDRERLPAGAVVLRDGEPYRGIGIVDEGWLMRSKKLPNGRRQVIDFVVPGEVLCHEAIIGAHSYYDLQTIGPAEVSWVGLDAVEAFFAEFPRIATAFNRFTMLEEAIMTERLLSVGQRSALERISHLVLELWHRLQLAGRAEDHAFSMPLTQENIGECLGLSTVHVNRILKELEGRRLLHVVPHRSIGLHDPERLARLALFKSGYLEIARQPIEEPPV